jgi:hypothetical protein
MATITALALGLTILPITLAATADAAPQSTSYSSRTNAPATPQWVYFSQFPEQWICVYEGNQLVASGRYQAASCRAGTPGQIALWVLTY